ncbi:heavy metal translocating P-type ATPase, partial [Candidatus Berkelbacteria bacterium]|nr:heavy metal translocating P-type ATPase [Candidatus Berkelbacteria bacterium]
DKTELQAKLPGMMTLISLAILAAYGWSVVATFFTVGGDFFWELATLITVMLLGHWIEMRSVSSAQGALHELAKFLPDMAERERTDGTTETVAIAQIVVGDVLIIRPGTKIPVDGEVIEGTSSLNEAMITGESNPIEKTVGSSMIAGTVNGHGVLKIRTTKIGADTALSGIMRLVAEAQASRSRAQVIADQAAFALTVAALMVGIGSLVVWLAVGQTPTFAFERLVTVLVIACPHALGLAVPLVTAISTTLAAKNGILIRKRITLEAARSLDVILFDKTGTLTSGEFGVRAYAAIPGRKSDDIFTVAAAVESASEHPLAQAMATKAKELKLALPKVRAIEAIPGQGVTGKIGGRTITVGGPQFLRARRLTIPTTLQSLTNQAGEQGQTIVYVLDGKEIIGAITLADQIRPESRAAIRVLHDLGLKIAMVTGDSQAVADAVAKELKIDTVFAQVLPEEKVKNVKELQIGGQRVAMVGDGVNDAAALTQADVGIAIGAGTDVAIESAGIVLMRNDPRDIVKILTLARATYAKTVQNLFWATGYNVVAIPLAAGVLVAQGILLAPALGAILMSLSTVIVATNAQLLRRLNLTMEQG